MAYQPRIVGPASSKKTSTNPSPPSPPSPPSLPSVPSVAKNKPVANSPRPSSGGGLFPAGIAGGILVIIVIVLFAAKVAQKQAARINPNMAAATALSAAIKEDSPAAALGKIERIQTSQVTDSDLIKAIDGYKVLATFGVNLGLESGFASTCRNGFEGEPVTPEFIEFQDLANQVIQFGRQVLNRYNQKP